MASAAEGLGARPSLPTAALFVPGHRPERYAKAARSGAGAVIVDLEDAVPPEAKEAARAALVREGAALRGAALWVRVRPGLGDLGLDLRAAVAARSAAVMLPKASSPGVLTLVAEELARLGSGAALVPLIETLAALPRLAALAAAPRVAALAFGPEDLAAEAGLRPEPAALAGPAQAVALAARAAGHGALGYPSTIGETRDLGRLRADMIAGRTFGFVGALCVHPAQVPVAAEVFAPSAEEVAWARRVLAAHDPTAGATLVDGRMVDAPVLRRASEIAGRAQPVAEG